MTHDHDHDCPCMFRQVQVAGEFIVEPPVRKRPSFMPPRSLTGFEMRVTDPPSRIIVSDLLTGVVPGCDVEILLLDESDEEAQLAGPSDSYQDMKRAAEHDRELTAKVA
jgi:hypothetical protein